MGKQAASTETPEHDHAMRTLSGVRFFQGFPDSALRCFAAAAVWQDFRDGDMIFDQESDGLEVHFITQGRVRLLAAFNKGDPVVLAEVEAGEIFGELAAIDQLPRSARAVAVANTQLASIDGTSFLKLLEAFPQVSIRMLGRLAGIIRSMDVRLANISVLSPTQRVVAELMRRAVPDVRVPGMWIIPFAPNHAEIASWVGLDKELVAQVIGGLARQTLLRRRGGSVVLMDWVTLQKMVKPANAREHQPESAEVAFQPL